MCIRDSNTSAWTTQNITYTSTPDWKVTFPANVTITCGSEFPAAAIFIETGNCNALSYNVTEEMVTNPSGTPRLERTYTVFNDCLNPIDTVQIGNVANGLMITSEGNEDLGAFNYVQYLDITDVNAPQLTITSPDPCISGQDFDAAPFNEEDISPGSAPYECDEIKTWSAQAVDDCDANLEISGRLFIDDNLIFGFDGASLDFVVEPNVTYTVEFSAVDDFGNAGFSTEQYTFFDCVRPLVQLRNGQTYTLPPSGALTVSAFDFDHSSFDNCSDQFNLMFRIWHGSLGGSAPTTLSEIQALPTALTFDITNIGTNLILSLIHISEPTRPY